MTLLQRLGRAASGFATNYEGARVVSTTTASRADAIIKDNKYKDNDEGLFSGLFGSSSRHAVPMTDPLPGVSIPEAVGLPTEQPKTEMTTLSNGIKVASEDIPGATTTIGLYVDCGSIYENGYSMGASHLLEYMAFKSTMNRTHLRLVREIEGIGGNVMASASREQMAYTVDTTKATVPEALEILCDAVLNPKFEPWEVQEQVKKMEEDLKNFGDNPQTTLLESLHSAAYQGALGRPLIAPKDVVGNLNADLLREFCQVHYVAPRMVLSAAGVGHSELLKLAEPLVSSVPDGPVFEEPGSQYIGGDWRQFAAGPMTHAVLAFEFAGGWRDVKGSVAMTVLQYLMGGGGSFSAGGPGKGMHSRLYTRVLNQHHWVHNCTAVTSIYNNSGLVGIFATAESSHTEEMIAVLCREMEAVATEITLEELERAKAAAKSSVLMNLESRAVVCEDIGRQILTYGHRKPIDGFISEIEAITAADIKNAVQKLLKSPPTLATLGDIGYVPPYDLVAKRFSS